MSKTVDERVVSMQFDNQQFEKNVQTSMSTLDKLKEKLQLKGAAKGAESEFAAYKSGFISLKDSINKMWSTWEYEIASKMKNLVKMFTIEPIKTGFEEYQTQLNSVQTILANTESKGSTLKDVNAALDELNAYADKTIYNFTEMTKNIGTFTAAGVELDTSVAAIKGIANLAAVSGSTSQQASTAMYQLSQALASGTVKLMDWNSVVNAGMGGQVFQDALKETARVHGVAIDEIINKNGSFRESLQEGWLTSEILTETLSIFTGDLTEAQLKSMGYTDKQIKKFIALGESANDAATKVKTFTQLLDTLKEGAQSGWAQTWELIFGDFEEAKAFWTKVSEEIGGLIGESAEKRNNLLAETLDSGWNNFLNKGSVDETGFTNFLYGAAAEAGELTGSVKDLTDEYGSLDKAIEANIKNGNISSESLAKALGKLSAQTQNYSDEQLKALGLTREQAEALAEFNEKIQNGDASIEDFYKKMKRLSGRELLFNIEYKMDEEGNYILDEHGKKIIEYTERTGALVNIYGALKKVMDTVAAAWREVFPEATSEGLYNLLDKFREFTSRLVMTDETANKVKQTFKGLFSVLSLIWSVIKLVAQVVGAILKALKPVLGLILNLTSALGGFINGLRETVKSTESFQKFSTTIVGFIENMSAKFKEFAASLKEKIQVSGLTGFMAFLKGLWTVVKTIFNGIVGVIKAVGSAISDTFNGGGVGSVLDLLNTGLLAGLIISIKKMFNGVDGILESFGDILDGVSDTLKAFTAQIKAKALESIATSMLMLAAAILVIALIDQDKLEKSLAALAMLFAGLMGAMSIGAGAKKSAITAVQMIGLATSMLILAAVLQKLSTLTDDEMLISLLVMAACMAALTGTLAVLSKIKSKTKMAMEGSKQLLKISLSLIPTVFILKQLADIYWKDLLISFGVMVGALAAFTASLYVLSTVKSKTKMVQEGAKRMFVLSLSLIPLAIALRLLSKMSWEDIAKSGVIIAAGLATMVVAMVALQKMDQATSKVKDAKANQLKIVIGKCVQLTMIAAALLMLATALLLISFISWTGIIKGLVGIAAMLGMLLLVFKVVAKTESASSVKSIGTLLAMTLMMVSLVPTLALLGQMDWDTIAKGLTAMAGTMVILGGALVLLSKLTTTSKKMSTLDTKSGLMNTFGEKTEIIQIAAALYIFAAAIKMLALSLVVLGQLKWSSILKGLTAIVGVVSILALASKFITVSSKQLLALSVSMALMGASCLAAGVGITLLAKSLAAFADALGTALVALCQVIIQSSSIIAKTIVTLIVDVLKALVDVVDVIVETLLTIVLNSIESLSKNIPSIASAFMDLLIGVIDEVINYLPQIGDLLVKLLNGIFGMLGDLMSEVDTDGLLKMAAGIGIMAAMVTTLASISIKMLPKALVGAIGVMALITAIGAAFGLLAKIDPKLADTIGSGGGLFYSIGYVIGSLISGLLAGLDNLEYKSSGIDAAVSMITKICSPELITALGLVAGLAAVLALIGKIKGNFLVGLTALTMMLGFVGVIVGLFSVLALEAQEGLPGLSKGIELLKAVCSPDVIVALGLLGGLTAIIALVGKLTTNFGNFAKAFAGLAMVTAIVAAILMMFGGIASIPGASGEDGMLSKGVSILEMVGSTRVVIALGALAALTGILGVIGLLGASVGTGVAAFAAVALLVIGVVVGLGSIAEYWNEAVLTTGIKMLEMLGSPKVLLALGAMAALAAVLGAIGLIGPAAFLGIGVLATLIVAVVGVITGLGALMEYWNSFGDLLDKGGDVLGKVGEALGKFVAGIISGFGTADASSLPGVAKHLSDFMTNLKPFLEGCKNIVIKDINNFKKLTKELEKLELDTFDSDLSDLTDCVINFNKKLSDNPIDIGVITNGCKAISKLCTSIESIPPSDGWVQKIKGGPDMDSFGSGLTALGKGVADFQASIAGGDKPVDLNTIKLGCDAIVVLAEAIDNIPSTGIFEKVGNWIKGSSKEEDFSINLKMLGAGVKAFANAIAGVSPEEVAAGGYAAASLAEAVNKIPEDGGIWDMDMPLLQSKFEGLANAVTSFVAGMERTSDAAITAAGMKLSRLNDALTAFSTAGIDSIINSFNNSRTNVAASVVSALDACVTAVGEYNSRIKDAGAKLGEQLVKGITSKSSEIKKEFRDILNNASNAIESGKWYDKFKGVGSDLVDGFVAGIDENTFKAKATAVAMAQAALDAAREVLRVKSPSRAFAEIGSYSGEGFVGGLESYMSNVYNAGYDMGDTAIDALSGSIAKVAQTIENGVDDQLTIRPVLDLSEVNSGINAMNGMLDTNRSIGVSANVDSISSLMSKNQNGGNSDVVTAIDNLKDTMLANTGNTTYTINGITYDDGSQIQTAIETIVRAIIRERRS